MPHHGARHKQEIHQTEFFKLDATGKAIEDRMVAARSVTGRMVAPGPASPGATSELKEDETMDYEVMWNGLKEGLSKRSDDPKTPVYDSLTLRNLVELMNAAERFNARPITVPIHKIIYMKGRSLLESILNFPAFSQQKLN